MNLFFQTFRTITRNFGMVWPPVVTMLTFIILTLLPFVILLAGSGMMLGFDNLLSGEMPNLEALPRLLLGFGFLAFFIFMFIAFIVYFLLTALVTAGNYSLASGVLDGNRHYWRNFFRGGLRYMGWGILYSIIVFAITLIGQILINSILSGDPFPAEESISLAARIVNTLFSIAMYYLFSLFFPALIDGKERFMEAIGTSMRLAWRTFLETILPSLLFILTLIVFILALVGIGYLTHPVVSALLGIPAILFLIPFMQVWMTLVYRKLTYIPDVTVQESHNPEEKQVSEENQNHEGIHNPGENHNPVESQNPEEKQGPEENHNPRQEL